MIEKTDITCLKILRKGSFFEEYLACINPEQENPFKFNLRTMKKPLITLSKVDEDIVMLELMVRSNIRHPFLINQICAFQDYNNLYYISEYTPIYLFDSSVLPKKFSTEITKLYAAEAFLCLKYLHYKKQNYTFISPDNVFLGTDGHLKLDYSFCNCIESKMSLEFDNLTYLSPDFFRNHKFSYLTDYWSLGLFIYRMSHGFFPFSGTDRDLIIADIKKCNITIDDSIDDSLIDIIKMLLRPDLKIKYPTCELFEDAIMSHKFFSNIDWIKLENKEYCPPFKIILPEYDIKSSPKLGLLYTSDFIVNGRDGYGNLFSRYNTVYFMKKNKF